MHVKLPNFKPGIYNLKTTPILLIAGKLYMKNFRAQSALDLPLLPYLLLNWAHIPIKSRHPKPIFKRWDLLE
jgi:hypothetical protein